MCGIVGYTGPKEVKKVLLDGLKALEYRGYDSAGIAVLGENGMERIRAAGELSNLEEKAKFLESQGRIGIGHTRWATHGKANELNAHPHTVGNVTLVHNGIIENYLELREDIKNLGRKLTSDTDSELIAHLVSIELEGGVELIEAVKRVRPKLSGAYAVLVMSELEPGLMVGFKKGPPLIFGFSNEGYSFASDVQAMAGLVDKIYYLNDDEVLEAREENFSLFDLKGNSKEMEWAELDWAPERAEKSGYDHFMLKEIHDQPHSFASAVGSHLKVDDHTVDLGGMTSEELKEIEHVFLVACGTSFYSGLYGKYIFEKFAGVPVEVDIASEFRYRSLLIPENSLAIFISQSGETADTLAALREVKSRGCKTLTLCNTKNSTMDRESDHQLYINSGLEIGVASTKAFVCSMGVLGAFGLALAKAKGRLSSRLENEYVEEFLGLPSKLEVVLGKKNLIQEWAPELASLRGYLYLGRGSVFPIALEGALKMKELAYKHAEGYAAGEMKHGPLALIDESMLVIVICPRDELYEKTLSNLEEARARGAKIMGVGEENDERFKSLSDYYFSLPRGNFLTNPVLSTLPLQLISYYVACSLGNNVDRPRNLAKSVTVE